MRKALFLSSFALAGLVSFNAAADELGEPGQLALGAERVFGVNFWGQTETPDDPAPETTTSGTSIGLVFNNPENIYTVPRFALDYFVADGVSIGGSIGYTSSSGESETDGTSTDLPDTSAFAIAPRVGYVIPLADGADLWLRGGITFFSSSAESDLGESTVSGFGLGVEGAFVLSPIEGFGFSIGPTVDVGVSGTQTLKPDGGDETEQDFTQRNFGLNAGLVGWF